MKTQSPLSPFIRHSDSVLVYRPLSPAQNPSPNSSPSSTQARGTSLIILCTWMNAQPRHISKYVAPYIALFPNATILILRSLTSDILFKAHPPLDLARSLVAVSDGVLIHAFSNGGANAAAMLLSSLPAELRSRTKIRGLVLDSAPGLASFRRGAAAFMAGLPKNPLARLVGWVAVYLLLGLMFAAVAVFRVEDVIARARRVLNDGDVLGLEVPRLYVYSKGDEIVWCRDVAEHAADARAKGCKRVEEIVYEESGHCAHALDHEKEYWEAVRGFAYGK